MAEIDLEGGRSDDLLSLLSVLKPSDDTYDATFSQQRAFFEKATTIVKKIYCINDTLQELLFTLYDASHNCTSSLSKELCDIFYQGRDDIANTMRCILNSMSAVDGALRALDRALSDPSHTWEETWRYIAEFRRSARAAEEQWHQTRAYLVDEFTASLRDRLFSPYNPLPRLFSWTARLKSDIIFPPLQAWGLVAEKVEDICGAIYDVLEIVGEIESFILNVRRRILHVQYDANTLSPELQEQVEAAGHRLRWTFTSHYLIMDDGVADIASISAHIADDTLSEAQESWSQTVTKGALFGVGFMVLKNLWEESTGVPAFS
ncbi:uncharacterized protein BT62DRAFT_927232 [Guyanagaster necrorhizus]|uniref:Uncharacterized protein n=1 Tax=Guyanagaster necrorhizus TaxID=856835 RepID=A0A9P8AXM4_9AGAR|nr:uncharacterized protein BT62DRAFT_927232 [Guyanagaster necrorhizus MCA 3950]KAG7451520.1 hypothetical protein BT62DRAFT_927232 [Guyanagaster necrorhizus MCA 3950]